MADFSQKGERGFPRKTGRETSVEGLHALQHGVGVAGRSREEAWRLQELDARASLDRIPALVATLTPWGEVEHLNRQARAYLGEAAGALKNWTQGGVVHPEDLPSAIEVLQKSLATCDAYELEWRLRRFDGQYRWFQGRALSVRDSGGRVDHWCLLLTDIEAHKQAELALRRSEALLAGNQLLSSTGTFSWRVVQDEIVWSAQLSRILEFDPRLPVTLALLEARVHPDDLSLFRDSIERARETARDFEYEFRLQLGNRVVKHLHVVAHGVLYADRELEYIGAVQDVTERRVAEQALEKARSELTRLTSVISLGVLTASIAHEINQPLSGIVTNASTCLRMLGSDPPNLDGARETARRTIRDGIRAGELTTRLRALYSRKEIAAEVVDLNATARDVIALSLSELHKNRVLIRQELAEELPLVTGDRVQLQQVLLNLLLNASDAMSSVDDRPRQLLVRTQRDEDDRVRLTVRDSGLGFDPADEEKLFEAFYTTKSSGMGIGLSVSRSIIESHRGRLWAALNEGPGATFSFSLRCRA